MKQQVLDKKQGVDKNPKTGRMIQTKPKSITGQFLHNLFNFALQALMLLCMIYFHIATMQMYMLVFKHILM